MAIRDLVPWKWGEKRVPVQRADSPAAVYDLWRDMDDLFDNFFNRFSLLPFDGSFGPATAFQPRIDVHETDTEVKVSAELPGLDEKDIELTVSDEALTISGEKKDEKEDRGRNYYRRECVYGSFQRQIPLPGPIDADKVEAVFKKGVLTVTLPKPPEIQKKRKTITVRAA
jgi:HSP20 family protein